MARARRMLALLLVLPLLPLLHDGAVAQSGGATASDFVYFKEPTPQPLCGGVAFNNSATKAYSRDDCGVSEFTLSNAGDAPTVEARLLDPSTGQPFTTVEASLADEATDTWAFDILPADRWPAGEIGVEIVVDGALAGESSFLHNALGATIEVPEKPGDVPYERGENVPVSGTVFQIDSNPPGGGTETGVPARFSLRLRTSEGEEIAVPGGPITAPASGNFTATIPGDLAEDLQAGRDTNFTMIVAVDVVDATFDDPDTGAWASPLAGSTGFELRTPPDGLIVENSFVSAVGWVKPGETYPLRVLVENFLDQAFSGARVTVPVPDGVTFTQAAPATGAGTAAILPDGSIDWSVGSVAAGGAEPTVLSLVLEARADTLEQDPQIVWKNLSSTATLTWSGGPAAGVESVSHGPKVIPVDERFDTARYGDRPFPVVPVDYFDRKHEDAHTGDLLADIINSPDLEGSTFKLYQEMSYGQLFPHGTVPSAGIASADFDYEPGFEFTNAEPQGTCKGTTQADFGTAGTPLYAERIVDGWYQMPGDTEYYGGDRFGSAVVGSVTGGPLFDIDSACGATAKAVWDAANIADPEIDYSDYDTDKDGVVDFFMMVFVGIGGNGESQTSAPPYDNIWPHSSSLEATYTDPETGLRGYVSDDQLKDLEGRPVFYTDASRTQQTITPTDFPVLVRVGPYNVNPETSIEQASVISHEYGHSLGLPDFYSSGSGRDTYGSWSLMATDHAQHIDIFGRQELGWVVPRLLQEGQTTVEGWKGSKIDTHRIDWEQPDGTPYTLEGPGVHNGDAYMAKLPAREIIDPAKFDSGETATAEHAWWSRSGNDFGCAPTGAHNLDIALQDLADVPANTPVTLTFKSLWDIEWDFDYGFTMISTDGGTSYEALPSERGYTTPATQNPQNNSCLAGFDNGLTGTSGSYEGGTQELDRLSGDYPDPVFLEDEYDLTAAAGEETVLRFSYSTDAGLARPGWFIDDIKVTAGDQVIFETDFEGSGGPDDARMFNGGCKEDIRVAALCTDEWLYFAASAGSPADHAYYLELRDRSGFDLDGNGQDSRAGGADFLPGLSLVYTDEAHGYGNFGVDDPPAQSPLDSQPVAEDSTPDLVDAAWTAAADDNRFSDTPPGHVDNYVDPRRPDGQWRFDYDCLSFEVTSMAGNGLGPQTPVDDLTADVSFDVGAGCAPFEYGLVAGAAGFEEEGACPTTKVPPLAFEDAANSVHSANVACVAWYGITVGKGDLDRDGKLDFDPRGSTTREQMASFVARLGREAGVALPATAPDAFVDDEGSTHEANINALAAMGIVRGKDATHFDPAGKVTREQLASLVARLHDEATGSLPEPSRDFFTDDEGSAHEANINALAELGVVAGKGGGLFDPRGFVTREQAASIAARELGVLQVAGKVRQGGAEVDLTEGEVAPGGAVTGTITTGKQIDSASATGCGLDRQALTLGADKGFSATIPSSQPARPCTLTIQVTTSWPGAAPQTVGHSFIVLVRST